MLNQLDKYTDTKKRLKQLYVSHYGRHGNPPWLKLGFTYSKNKILTPKFGFFFSREITDKTVNKFQLLGLSADIQQDFYKDIR